MAFRLLGRLLALFLICFLFMRALIGQFSISGISLFLFLFHGDSIPLLSDNDDDALTDRMRMCDFLHTVCIAADLKPNPLSWKGATWTSNVGAVFL